MNDETVRTSEHHDVKFTASGMAKRQHFVQDQSEETPDFTDLKIRINTILWEALPGSVTLARAEEIACAVFQAIYEEW